MIDSELWPINMTKEEKLAAPLRKIKSLMLVGVPKSGSTTLSRACSYLTKMRCIGEILNFKHYQRYQSLGLSAESFAFNSNNFDVMKRVLINYRYNSVVKDVVQTNFVVSNLSWINEHFNVLYIDRPIDSIIANHNQRGWPHETISQKKNVLDDIDFMKISFEDFVMKESVLREILGKWYLITKDSYMTKEFLAKRLETLGV